MLDRTFVDTNVLVYAIDGAEPAKRDRARAILGDGENQLVLSAQVLGEFYAVATRKLAVPLSPRNATEAVRSLAALPVVAADAELVIAAAELCEQAQISFWDAQIVVAAATAGCARLLTEDLSHGSELLSVRIENPFRSD